MTFEEYVNNKYNIVFPPNTFKTKQLKKGSYLTKHDTIEQNCYFIEDGVVEAEIIKNDDFFTFDFFFETEICSAYTSLLLQKPSNIALRCLSNCTITVIPQSIFKTCYNDNLQVQNFLLKETNKLYLKRVQKEKDLFLLTAKERYNNILTKNNKLLDAIPLYKLAAYLKITPESLSRIRRNIS